MFSIPLFVFAVTPLSELSTLWTHRIREWSPEQLKAV
jgi:hypothetical protein